MSCVRSFVATLLPAVIFVSSISLSREAVAQIVFNAEAGERLEVGSSCSSEACIKTVDLNGDGMKDLILNSYHGVHDLDVFYASESGYVQGPSLLSEYEIDFVCTGDIDGDGHLDLMTAQYSRDRTVTICRGDGIDGFLAPEVQSSVRAVSGNGRQLIDLDHDGELDILTGSGYRMGQEGLSFGDPTYYARGALGPVIDLDGDGSAEVFNWRRVGNRPPTYDVQVYSWTEGGLSEVLSFQSGSKPVDVADLNGDGELDLISETSFALGMGDGTFDVTETALPIRVYEVADMDDDGALDLLGRRLVDLSYRMESAVIMRGDGWGQFAQPQTIPTGGDVSWLQAVDTNADGKLELFAVTRESLSIIHTESNGLFAKPKNYTLHENPAAFDLGSTLDYDQDGHLDVLLRGELFRGTGEGTTEATSVESVNPSLAAWLGSNEDSSNILHHADMDGDGSVDLVRFGSRERIDIYWRHKDGSSESTTFLTGSETRRFLTSADFNGDGERDIAITTNNNGGEILIFDNRGDRSFASPRTYMIPNKMSADLLTGDFDGDGDIDLFVLFDGTKILFNNGDGTFEDEKPVYFDNEWPQAAGDFDGNGVDDLFLNEHILLLGDVSDSNLDSWPEPPFTREGDNGDDDRTRIAYPTGYELRSVADFNGDGNIDVLLSSFRPQTLLCLEGTGDGAFHNPTYVSPRYYLNHVLHGDFNEDGNIDLAGLTNEGVLLIPGEGTVPMFRRGEINGDASINIADAISSLNCLFSGATTCVTCEDSRDINDDGAIDISDSIRLLIWLFISDLPPAAPFAECGHDATPDGFTCASGNSACL